MAKSKLTVRTHSSGDCTRSFKSASGNTACEAAPVDMSTGTRYGDEMVAAMEERSARNVSTWNTGEERARFLHISRNSMNRNIRSRAVAEDSREARNEDAQWRIRAIDVGSCNAMVLVVVRENARQGSNSAVGNPEWRIRRHRMAIERRATSWEAEVG